MTKYERQDVLSNQPSSKGHNGSNSHKDALHSDVLILGAGAAGLLCARAAARRGRKVTLLDHAATPGRKIAVSGGGKANFTNLHMNTAHYVGHPLSPTSEFCEPALSEFSPKAITSLLAEHGMAWEEREHGQLFGLEKAEKLVDALLRDCQNAGCQFLLQHSIEDIEHSAQGFTVQARDHGQDKDATRALTAASLVLALGSPAWPQAGATDMGARLAKLLGHIVHPFRPVLVPFRMPATWALQGLSGISLKARLRTGEGKEAYERVDDLLFTHAGISGPAALQISCRWHAGQEILMDFLPHCRFDQELDTPEHGKLLVRTLLCRHMPQRLADALLPKELARRKVAELSRAARNALRDCVHEHRVIPAGHEGMRRAEAAAGGVNILEVNPWSMESLVTPRLFVVGELLDVTGHLGGYNLHWAWASGQLAGQHT